MPVTSIRCAHKSDFALQAAGLNVTSVLLYKLDYGPTDTPASSAAAPAPLAAVPIPASASHGLPSNTIAGARLAPAAKAMCCPGCLARQEAVYIGVQEERERTASVA